MSDDEEKKIDDAIANVDATAAALHRKNRRVDHLLALACEIVVLEQNLTVKRAEFHRLVGETRRPTPSVGERGRPTIQTKILDTLTEDRDYLAIEIKRALPEFSHGSIDVQLGRMVGDGTLVRVRWGTYRKPSPVHLHENAPGRAVSDPIPVDDPGGKRVPDATSTDGDPFPGQGGGPPHPER